MTAFFSSPLLDYAAVDGTAAYPEAEHCIRQALFLRPDHAIIADDMRLKAPGRIEWNLNSAGKLTLAGTCLEIPGCQVKLIALVCPRPRPPGGSRHLDPRQSGRYLVP